MAVFWITLNARDPRHGKPVAFPMDVPACTTPADFSEIDEPIFIGDRLVTAKDGHGGRRVKSREEVAVGFSGISMIAPYASKIWEWED